MIIFNFLRVFLFFICFFPLIGFGNEALSLPHLNNLIHNFHAQYNSDPPLGTLNEVACTGEENNAICIGVGDNYYSGPLLIKSLDGGKSFNFSVLTSNYGALLGVSCTGNSPSAVCVAGGYLGETDKGKPYLMQSINAGVDWYLPPLPGVRSYGLFRKISCTGGMGTSPAICVAVGWGNDDNSSKKYPIIAQSIDGGKTWGVKSINNLSPNTLGQLYSVSCTGEGNNAMCVAIGNYSTNDSTIPLIAQSIDGGQTWSKANYLFATNLNSNLNLIFEDVNCNGGNTNTICTIAGRVGTEDPLFNPVIYRTTDRGITWINNSLEAFPPDKNGSINAISCAGLGSNSFCSAVGAGSLKPTAQFKKESSSSFFPLILQSFGEKWLVPSLNNPINTWQNFYSSSCVNDSTHFCLATGYGINTNGKQYPVIAVTSNNLLNWEAKTIDNLPSQGLLKGSSCIKSGSLCVAVGNNQVIDDNKTINYPLIIEAQDKGVSWNISNIPYSSLVNHIQLCDPKNIKCIRAQTANSFYTYDIQYTTDGGNSWERTDSYWQGDEYSWFYQIAGGTDITNSVLVGMQMTATSYRTFPIALRTADGGKTWRHNEFSIPSACDEYGIDSFDTVQCDETGLNCKAQGHCTTINGERLSFEGNV
jgi:hypothetical protein